MKDCQLCTSGDWISVCNHCYVATFVLLEFQFLSQKKNKNGDSTATADNNHNNNN